MQMREHNGEVWAEVDEKEEPVRLGRKKNVKRNLQLFIRGWSVPPCDNLPQK